MSSFRKNLLTNVTLIAVLVCTLIHLLIITLSLFGSISIKLYDEFSYLIAYFMIVISLILYILGFFIEKITKLRIPSWLEVLFYIAFFVFTNTYYILNAYSNLFAVAFLFLYISFLVTIINISIFYHTQKDENNKLKGSKNYILTSIFFYSVGTNAILELLISMFKSFIFPNFILSTLDAYIVEFSAMTLSTIIMTVLLNLSLSRTKKFINSCLIRTK